MAKKCPNMLYANCMSIIDSMNYLIYSNREVELHRPYCKSYNLDVPSKAFIILEAQ